MAEVEQDQEVVKGFKSHIPLIIGFLVLVIAAWYWHKQYSKYINTDDAFVDSDKVGIASKMVGRITKIYFQETDSVKKGSLMAELDSSELKSRQLDIKTMVEQDLVSVRNADSQYDLSKENIDLQEINEQKAKTDLSRAKMQYEGGVITLENYEHIQRDYESSEAKRIEAEKKADYSKSQITVSLAKLEKSKALYVYISTLLNNTRLYAPIDGYVAKRYLLPGDVVLPGQPVYFLIRNKSYWVSVFLEEPNLSFFKIGSNAIILIDAFPRHPLKGKVFYISSNIASQFTINPPNNGAGNFTKISQRFNLKITIDGAADSDKPDKILKIIPGMSAVVKIFK